MKKQLSEPMNTSGTDFPSLAPGKTSGLAVDQFSLPYVSLSKVMGHGWSYTLFKLQGTK